MTTFEDAKPGELLMIGGAVGPAMIGFKARDHNGEAFICLTPTPEAEIYVPLVILPAELGRARALSIDGLCQVVPDLYPDSCSTELHALSGIDARGCLFLSGKGDVAIGVQVGGRGRSGTSYVDIRAGAVLKAEPPTGAVFKRWKITYNDGTIEPTILYEHKPKVAR